jgi:hypothetical protein
MWVPESLDLSVLATSLGLALATRLARNLIGRTDCRICRELWISNREAHAFIEMLPSILLGLAFNRRVGLMKNYFHFGVRLVFVSLWLCLLGCPSYRSDVARVKEELKKHNSIAMIQAWLRQPEAASLDIKDRSTWPPCITEIRPFGEITDIARIEAGGISLRWRIGDLVGVDIFPPGQRPVRTPMWRKEYCSFHAPYDNDAYVWIEGK